MIMNFLNKLRERWGVRSTFQFLVIMLVFAITGSLALYLSRPLLDFLQLNPENTNSFIYYPLRLLVVFPIYQIVLIIIATLFGQFRFFWTLEKKMLERIGISWLIDVITSIKKS